MRWLVETKQDVFSDVGAKFMAVHESGALIFRNGVWEAPSLVLAPGTWLWTVTPEPEEGNA